MHTYCQSVGIKTNSDCRQALKEKAELTRAAAYIEQDTKEANELAITILKSILQRNPRLLYAHKLLSTAYIKSENLEKALGEFVIVARLEPKVARNHLNLGMMYYATGAIRKAEESFYRAIGICLNSISKHNTKKKNYDALMLLGDIYRDIAEILRKRGDMDKAKELYVYAKERYVEVLAINPQSEALFDLANICYILGEKNPSEYEAALAYVKKYLTTISIEKNRQAFDAAAKLEAEITRKLHERKRGLIQAP